MQSGAQLGYSVAVDGGYTVAGAPFDHLLGENSGVVKIFDSNTGALLHVLSSILEGEQARVKKDAGPVVVLPSCITSACC